VLSTVTLRSAAALLAATLALLATALPSAASGDTVENARNATAVYNDPAAALAGGYEPLTDAAGLACIDLPGTGAMGVHFVKGALVQSGTLDAARPQALVYEVQPNGQMHLAALEYVVFQAAWDATHSGPPMLFGQKFMLNAADNRFGLPAFYALHAWVWERNPQGTFETWNPRVRCTAQANASGAIEDAAAAPAVADMNTAFMCAVPTNAAPEPAEEP
jgi:hypothetical protein